MTISNADLAKEILAKIKNKGASSAAIHKATETVTPSTSNTTLFNLSSSYDDSLLYLEVVAMQLKARISTGYFGKSAIKDNEIKRLLWILCPNVSKKLDSRCLYHKGSKFAPHLHDLSQIF